jgi:transcription termination factor Rho
VSETTELIDVRDATDNGAQPETQGARTRRRSGTGLAAMVLPELQALASSLGISGTARMRKGQLIEAIQAKQSGGGSTPAPTATVVAAQASKRTETVDIPEQGRLDAPGAAISSGDAPSGVATQEANGGSRPQHDRRAGREARRGSSNAAANAGDGGNSGSSANNGGGGSADAEQGGQQSQQASGQGQSGEQREQRRGRDNNRNNRQDQRRGNNAGQNNQNSGGGNNANDDDDERGGRRRNRYRDRNRNRRGGRESGGYDEPQVSEDDVLIPVAGILDILDNYAFVRTSGYLPGPNDVYVSLAQVRKYGLRRGDAIAGAVRQPRDGERREKFNALVRLDQVNGLEPDEVRTRADFSKLTPLYPQDRLRLETEPGILTTRIIDLVAPIGKGQRGLIMSPSKSGKTTVLKSIANAITTNNPECYLMVVLIDERPEEVTDMQRSVKGEIIASTFDRPADDHTMVAELAIERAKRLTELGHDVVVLLDSITRLGRAYNLAAPTSGRILTGGVDSTALYPPKRFFGAARNIENGGSLTILATALVETGSRADEVIFEEFKGTGNMELKLDRKLAEKRIFPAIDVDPSGTRKEEILMSPEELAIIYKLRRVLHALDSQQAIELLLDRVKKTKSNVEFLMQIQKTTLGPQED